MVSLLQHRLCVRGAWLLAGFASTCVRQRDGFHQADTQLSALSDLETQCIWLCLITVDKTQSNQGYFIYLHSSRKKKMREGKSSNVW